MLFYIDICLAVFPMHFGFFFSFSIILADTRSMIANNRSLACLRFIKASSQGANQQAAN